MAERCIKGDYIGFTFGGVHSSELGLMRVSDGSRYNQDLLPPLQDKVAQVNGRDGAVYFGSQYNTRPIKVPVAFDNMTEESFNQLKRLLQDKKPKYLWFDETPYKQWLVKAANAQNFKWICFDESRNGKEKRIYKGEGTLEFSCFSPYAESRVTFLDNELENIVYKDKKQLKIGNPPYLEEITIELDGTNKIVHIQSEAVLNNDLQDNIFIIPEYGVFDVSIKETLAAEKGKYVDFYENKGYLTMVEHDSPNLNNGQTYEDTTDGIEGIRSTFLMKSDQIKTNGFLRGTWNAFKCFIITTEQVTQLTNWFENSNSTTFVIRGQNYGHHYPEWDSFTLSKDSKLKKGSYNNWYLFPTTNSGQTVLLEKNSEGKLTLLTPIWEEDFETRQGYLEIENKDDTNFGVAHVTGYTKPKLGVKILSPKGFEKKQDGSIKVAKNKLLNFYNYAEWAQSSGLRKQYDAYDNPLYNVYDNGNNLMSVYNAGDIPIDCKIIISKTNWENYTLSNTNPIKFSITSSLDTITEVGKLIIKPFSLLSGDEGIILDSKLKLIKGYRLKQDGSIELTGTVYNKNIKEGDFFKIPVCTNEEYYEVRSYANIPFEIQYKHHYI